MLRTVQFLPPAPPDPIKEPTAEAMQNAPLGYVLFLSLWACCQCKMRETDTFLKLHRSWLDSIKATVKCAQLWQRFWAVRCPNRFSSCVFVCLRVRAHVLHATCIRKHFGQSQTGYISIQQVTHIAEDTVEGFSHLAEQAATKSSDVATATVPRLSLMPSMPALNLSQLSFEIPGASLLSPKTSGEVDPAKRLDFA